jgi:cyclically-permuted mutarotase family protein
MDKAKLSNRIASFGFWVLSFEYIVRNSKLKTQNSKPFYPLSILLILTLIFSKSNNITAQKSTDFRMNWQIIGSLPAPNIGVAGAFSGIHNGAMIVAGGANFPNGMPWEGGKKQYSNEVFVYTKYKKGTLKRHHPSFNLLERVAYGASVSTPKGIVYIGGENEKGASNKAFLMTWNRKKQQIEQQNLADLPLPLTNAAATCIGNTIYIIGGESDNKTTPTFLSLDINESKTTWQVLPNLPKPISHAVVAALSKGQNKGIYVMGGRAKTASGISDLYDSAYKFDIKQNIWTPLSKISDGLQTGIALTAGTGIAIDNQSIVLFGGDKGETFHQVETLLAAINTEKNKAKKQTLTQQKNQLLATHPGFSKDILLYNTETNKWTKIGSIPFDTPVTTTAFKWGKRIIIPSGEIRAGVRTPYILAVDIQNEK